MTLDHVISRELLDSKLIFEALSCGQGRCELKESRFKSFSNQSPVSRDFRFLSVRVDSVR